MIVSFQSDDPIHKQLDTLAKSKPKPKPTREQELAEQVAYLKAKVAYLEKLRALRASKSRGASEAPSSDCSQGGDTGSATS
jgi:transposase